MYYLIYNSYALPGFKEDELESMSKQGLEKNKEHCITGMLLYFNGKFLQLIEGEKQAVKQLYQNILNDERHTNILVLKEGTSNVPFFADWSMGYQFVQPDELANQKGFKDLSPLNTLHKRSALKLFKILSANK
jgi:hypothetical protein